MWEVTPTGWESLLSEPLCNACGSEDSAILVKTLSSSRIVEPVVTHLDSAFHCRTPRSVCDDGRGVGTRCQRRMHSMLAAMNGYDLARCWAGSPRRCRRTGSGAPALLRAQLGSRLRHLGSFRALPGSAHCGAPITQPGVGDGLAIALAFAAAILRDVPRRVLAQLVSGNEWCSWATTHRPCSLRSPSVNRKRFSGFSLSSCCVPQRSSA
jgi:hypothetical protein